jgi:hypothetical protein
MLELQNLGATFVDSAPLFWCTKFSANLNGREVRHVEMLFELVFGGHHGSKSG